MESANVVSGLTSLYPLQVRFLSGRIPARRRERIMQVSEAKNMVLPLLIRDLAESPVPILVESGSPDDRDPGKFRLDDRTARIIHHFSGWHVKIHRDWFHGSLSPPEINGSRFFWYVFAIPRLKGRSHDHYFVCDYLQMRDWVLSFAAPRGNDHRDHEDWLAGFRIFPDEKRAYLRWGDEPLDYCGPLHLNRFIRLDNVASLALLRINPALRIGTFGLSGESEAHRALKLFVAGRPGLIGLSLEASAELEHPFCTGDRVDLLFNNHAPDRTVVEIELSGEDNLRTGVHQAIKYRALAEAENGFPQAGPRVGALVVAYHAEYSAVEELASRYNVRLLAVDQRQVLAAAV